MWSGLLFPTSRENPSRLAQEYLAESLGRNLGVVQQSYKEVEAMATKILTWALFFLLAALSFPSGVQAQQIITVTIEPACTNPPPPATSPSPLTLATSTTPLICGPYKIEPKSTGNARIEVGTNDLNNDVLALLNTKITKTAASIPDLHITFWAKSYRTLPNDVPPGNRKYTMSAGGFFMRGINPLSPLATGDSIKFSGFLDMPDNDGTVVWYPLGSSTPQYQWTVTNNNNIPAANGVTKPFGMGFDPTVHTLSMKGEVWVHLADPNGATTDKLSITALQIQEGPLSKPKDKSSMGQ
jgi:hypothetical protein